MNAPFAPRGDHDAVELGTLLMPKFDADGLIVAIATDAALATLLPRLDINDPVQVADFICAHLAL